MYIIRSLLIALLLTACGAGEDGKRAVESAGFTDVVIGDSATWRCGEDDSYNSHFTAVNAQGRKVSGVVCCGTSGCSKACTVRF